MVQDGAGGVAQKEKVAGKEVGNMPEESVNMAEGASKVPETGQNRQELSEGGQQAVPDKLDGMLTEMFQKGKVLDLAALQHITTLLGEGGDSLPERPLVLAGPGQKCGKPVLFRETRPQPTRRYKSKQSKLDIDIWKPHGGTSTRRLLLPPSLQPPHCDTPQEIIRRSGKIIRAVGESPLRYRQYELGSVGDKSKSKTGLLLFHVLEDTLGFQGKAYAAADAKEKDSLKKIKRNQKDNSAPNRTAKKQRICSLPMQLPADDALQTMTSSEDWYSSSPENGLDDVLADAESWLPYANQTSFLEWTSDSSSDSESSEPWFPPFDIDLDSVATGADYTAELTMAHDDGFCNETSDSGEDDSRNESAAADESSSRSYAGAVVRGSASMWTVASAGAMSAAVCMNTSTLLLQDDSGTAALHRSLQDSSETDYSLHMFIDGNLSSAAAPTANLPLSHWPDAAAAAVAAAETLRVCGDYLLTPEVLVPFEIFVLLMIFVALAVDAVFDLRHQPKLDLYVGFFVRQNLIRFMVWIRALKTLRPITDYALHVLLLIGIFSEAYLWLRNTVKVDSRASRLDVYRVPPLVGMARGLAFCCATEYAITQTNMQAFDDAYYYEDTTTASLLRAGSVIAVRTLWGALRVWRGSCLGVMHGAPRSDAILHPPYNPEMKLASEAFVKLRTRAPRVTLGHGGVAHVI